MRIGVIFPQTEIGNDPGAIREYAQTAEDLGYSHVLVYDHVLGVNPDAHPGFRGVYTHEHAFHEPFVLFGLLAGITTSLELTTGIIILPQRQAALVAKQAAEVDVLSNGRLRLGIGNGWNSVEFDALGEDFHTRGRRIQEQIEILRRLWTGEVADYEGRWHHLQGVGIKPLPVQRPIPIWMGGMADPVLRRAARTADGWFPQIRPDDRGRELIEQFRAYVREAGRDPASVGVEARVSVGQDRTPEDAARDLEAWQTLGVSHVGFNTMGVGYTSPRQHIQAIRRFMDAARTIVGA